MRPSLASLVAVASLLACARSTPEWPPRTGRYEIDVSVENDLIDRSDLVVRMVSNDGSTLLGGVPPGEERSFTYRSRFLSGRYRLTAQTGDGRTVRSRAFTLFPGAVVRWQVELNHLRVLSGSHGRAIAPHGSSGSAPSTG